MAKEARDTIEYKQATLPPPKPPELNIVPTKTGSVLNEGELSSPNFRTGSLGWRVETNGRAEFRDIIASGTFNIGGTVITVNNVSEISDALTTIQNAGGGTLYLDNGTYVLTSDINVPSGVTIEGVSRDGVIINCNSAYAIKLNGTNTYTTGTVAITNGTTTVTGSGTTWTSAMIGRYIFLDGAWYEITNRSSNTQITIGSTFTGNDLSGASYAIATPNSTTTLRRLTIYNATGSGVISQYSSEPKYDDLLVYGCGTGMEFDYCYAPYIFSSVYENGVNLDFNYVYAFRVDFSAFDDSTTGNGVTMTNSGDATFFDSSVSGNTGDGINLTNCRNIVFVSLDVSSNGGQGIELVSGNTDIQFIGATAISNTSDGYKLTATSDRISITGCSIKDNGGYGINIAASTCDDNYIVAPVFSGNTSGEVNDSGTNTVRIQETDTLNVLYGDGSDGDVVISSGTTTLSANKFYRSLTVSSGATLDCAGYAVYSQTPITNAGTIKNNGGNGGNGSNNTTNIGGAGGSAGAASGSGFFTAGPAGKVGGAGGNGGGNGSNGTAGANQNPSLGSNGVAGGNGGYRATVTTGGTGGGGGTATSETLNSQATIAQKTGLTAGSEDVVSSLLRVSSSSNGIVLSSSAGSGSGGGGGGSTIGSSGGGGGGGSGGGGGVVFLCAPTITNTGTIQANGGNGGNGGDTDGVAGGGGGGGGGSGGIVILMYETLTNSGTIQAAGGTKGLKGVSGDTAGTDGTDGNAGKIFKVKVGNNLIA